MSVAEAVAAPGPTSSATYCVLIEIVRAQINFFEQVATTWDIGPNVETVWRGVYGDRRDGPSCWILLEISNSARFAIDAMLRDPELQPYIHRVIYEGVTPSDAGPPPPSELAVYRPVPQRNSDGSYSGATWGWFETSADYRAALTPPR